MKELSIEEKAKAYDEALRVLHKYDGAHIMFTQDLKEEMFPELKESEDERIREKVIATIHLYYGEPLEDEAKEMIAWLEEQGQHKKFRDSIQVGDKVTRNKDGVLVNLSQLKRVAKPAEKQSTNMGISEATKQKLEESLNKALEKETPESCNEFLDKQCEQKPAVEMKSAEESLGIDSDTYNKIVDECIYGEQKPVDKVGQTIKKEGFNLGFTIVKIEDGFYYNDKGDYFSFTDQDNWELVEQKPAEWSEDDERILNTVIYNLRYPWVNYYKKPIEKEVKWLKSLKDRYTWKPSDEQMTQLKKYCPDNRPLTSLYEQLKKIKG